MLLLRIGKRRTSWEPATSLSDLLEAEFTNDDGTTDLAVSVYEIEAAQVVQAFTEHSASAGNRPPTGKTNVDLTGHPGTKIDAPVVSAFKLIRETHRELAFDAEPILSTFVETVRGELAQRAHEVKSAQLKEFVRGRREANDPEWCAFVLENEAWRL